ncbi:GNAT family N-acetyltransferase [Clostridioides difficile]
MKKIIFRKATADDMLDINKLELDVFSVEQKIPKDIIPISQDKNPSWWCTTINDVIIGAVASWYENRQVHWGRFAIRKDFRSQHIGTELARFSIDDLFSQDIDEIFMEARDTTVKIICNLGGMVTGKAEDFYNETVTPVTLQKIHYHKRECL